MKISLDEDQCTVYIYIHTYHTCVYCIHITSYVQISIENSFYICTCLYICCEGTLQHLKAVTAGVSTEQFL